MSGIDWSKAPADATHYHPKTDRFSDHWIKPGFFCVCGSESGGWVRDAAPALDKSGYIARLVGWNGEGLPPVGTACETLWSSTKGEYMPVVVVGHDGDLAVVRFTAGERKGEYGADKERHQFQYPIFRPIRTAEQIAAEEREKAIGEMIESVSKAERYTLSRFHAEALYDAGYRKLVQP